MFKIVPRDEAFFDQIERLSALSKSAAEQLTELVRTFPNTNGNPALIEKARADASELLTGTQCRLDDAFITPLDREDILQLTTDLFDVVDKVADLAQRFSLYQLSKIYPGLDAQCRTLRDITVVLSQILAELRHDKKLKELSPQLDKVSALEKQAGQNRDRFLSELFQNSPDPLEVIKKKELHDMLESAIWDCENVTRTLSRVLLKNGQPQKCSYASFTVFHHRDCVNF